MGFFEELINLRTIIKAYLGLPLISYVYFSYQNFLFWWSFSLAIISWVLLGINIAFIESLKYKTKGKTEKEEDEEISKHPILSAVQALLVFNGLINLFFSIILFIIKKDLIAFIFMLILMAGFSFLIVGSYMFKERILKNSKEIVQDIKLKLLLRRLLK